MEKVLHLYKPLGISPLDSILEFKAHNPEYSSEKMGYAGRLDPMAEGLLLVLVGEENKERKKYLNLDKTYEVTVLFGVETDTYDILGKIVHEKVQVVSKEDIEDTAQEFMGEIIQQFPPFSSKTVNGEPLYKLARDGRINEIDLPTETRTIYSINVKKVQSVTSGRVSSEIYHKLNKVKGNFRQADILTGWRSFFVQHDETNFVLADLIVSCSSGTYMRQLAQDIGKKLKTPALAFSIKRTKVGEYDIKQAQQIQVQ